MMVNTNNETEEGDCPVCKKAYTNREMAECPKCLKWIHYKCAKVNDDVANDESWMCEFCKSDPPLSVKSSSKKTSKSKSSSKNLINKEKLALVDEKLKLIQEKEKLLSERAKIIESMDDDDSSDDSKAFHGRNESDEGGQHEQKPMSSKEVVENFLKTLQNKSMQLPSNLRKSTDQLKMISQNKSTAQRRHPQNVDNGRAVSHVNAVNADGADGVLDERCDRIDYRQFSVRQSLAKALPTFNGRPEEWPVFISSFKYTTEVCQFNNTENMIRLNGSLKGKAREVVEPMLTLPHCVGRVIETLQLYFGRPEILIEHYLSKIRQLPPPRADRLESLFGFAIDVQNLCVTIEQTDQLNHLYNPMLLKELTEKLPPTVKMNWAAYKRLSADGENLKTMSEFLRTVSEDLCSVGVSLVAPQPIQNKKSNARESVHMHEETQDSGSKSGCKACQGNCSDLVNCEKFKQMSINNRWNVVKNHRLCNRCLKKHKTKCEKAAIPCKADGCDKKYHSILHKHVINVAHINHNLNSNKVLFRIMPVKLFNGTKYIRTYAFLDEGSSSSLISESLCNQLGLVGTRQPFCMKWTNNISNWEENSQIVNMEISGVYEMARKTKLDHVRSVKSLKLPQQTLNYAELCEKYSYLRQLPIQSYENANPQILIGLLNWKVAVPTKSKFHEGDGPVAVKCYLGWTICASPNELPTQAPVYSCHVCECTSEIDHKLNDMVNEYFNVDSLGICDPKGSLKAIEENRAMQIMEKTTSHSVSDGRFQTGLLWRSDQIRLPDSRKMALQRLKCFEKRLKADPEMLKIVQAQIKDYLEKGYIRKLSDVELREKHDRVWYLPIFTVQNPNKPDKIRMVWDAKATVNGVSLNTALLKGVDLNSSLLGVLFRSRERKICICADISEMFHRIKVNDEDQHVLRFYWRNCDDSKDPETYVMMVMTFGATCSPFCAQYIKNQNAMTFFENYPRAVTSIIKNHYVDDLLDSVDNENEALNLARDVKMIHSKAGFNICKWKSNSKHVMQSLNQEDQSNKVDLNPESCTEKVLGMWWMLDSDEYMFSFKFNKGNRDVLNGHKIPTKRELLKILMSIYDPMGLISCYTVYLKMLLQDMWKAKTSWDEVMNDQQSAKWFDWLKYLPEIEKLRIPRCLLSKFDNWSDTITQLHVFTDAGEECCVCVAYLRISKGNDIDCVLVGSKTKVAPIKARSIPRLELDAAVMGCRFATTIKEEFSIEINKCIYWCDSSVVLSWLRNKTKRFSKFVGFRTVEILDNSSPSEWRQVPSKLNIADVCTKWDKKTIKPNISEDIWFKAPTFLSQCEESWPHQNFESDDVTEEECCMIIDQPITNLNTEIFTSWKEALNVISDCYRFIANLRMHPTNKFEGLRTNNELEKAKIWLLKMTQSQFYHEEMHCLHYQKHIKRSSALYKLSPYLDEDGLLRIKGRLDAAKDLPFDAKRPLILPRQHHITFLIVADMHCKFVHQNHETVVNTLRQVYYIPKLRCVLKTVRKNCPVCKIRSVKLATPEMAPLPDVRLQAFTEPFTYTGVDCFGPFYVAVGRRREKRWGVIFTCLTVRAIHLEVIQNMDADAFILCFRNFMARRGQPRKIFSDNGTNFVKSERLLREELENVDFNKVAREFISPELSWHFNPPSCAHMGGAWERLIRSVKRAVYDSLPLHKTPSDALLTSCLITVEGMVNCRPLTYLPIDSEEHEAITPNHFLRLSGNGCKPIGMMDDSVKTLKYNYQCLEQFANKCWRRFIMEYLPELTCRTKWYEKAQPLRVGDIVVIVDQKLPRNNYPKARVVEVFPGPDGQIRRAKIQTNNTILERPTSKLAVLNIRDDSE